MIASTVIIGLGSNIGDRQAYLSTAVEKLAELLHDMRSSRIMESQALLPPGAPPEWDRPYLNMAVSGMTNLSPQALLDALNTIERGMGRKARGIWGPREIDMDILAMEDIVMEDAALTIPHRCLLERDFALLPLVELAPDWRYPAAGKYHGWRAAEIAKDKGFTL